MLDEETLVPTEETPPAAPPATPLLILRELAETIFLAVIIFFFFQLVIKNFRVEGQSMEPNLHEGQYLMVDKLSYHLPFRPRLWQRGDIVIFIPPENPARGDYVKRVLALPGETIELQHGQILIDGLPVSEPYQPQLDNYSMPAQTVPAGYLFVMGDNRRNSSDSRHWGLLAQEKIDGRVILSYWPPRLWGWISHDAPTAGQTLWSLFNTDYADYTEK